VLSERSTSIVDAEKLLTTNIRLARLETGVFSPRKAFSQRYIDELAEDIEREGQLKPIIVRPHPEKPNVYQVVDGEHRVRAFRKLGRSLIRAEVRALSDEEAFFLAMRVNQMHGKRLEGLEEGLHIKKMMNEFGYTQTQIAEKFNKTQAWVSYRLRLAERLSPETKEAFITRVIKISHARELAELPKEDQPAVVARVVNERLSFKDTETLVHALKEHPDKKEEILTKPINELTPPPKDIQEFEEEHGPEQPKFEVGRCPRCGAEYVINWPLCRINWREKSEREGLPRRA
jgi:ParB family chromosome partitioning protein